MEEQRALDIRVDLSVVWGPGAVVPPGVGETCIFCDASDSCMKRFEACNGANTWLVVCSGLVRQQLHLQQCERNAYNLTPLGYPATPWDVLLLPSCTARYHAAYEATGPAPTPPPASERVGEACTECEDIETSTLLPPSGSWDPIALEAFGSNRVSMALALISAALVSSSAVSVESTVRSLAKAIRKNMMNMPSTIDPP